MPSTPYCNHCLFLNNQEAPCRLLFLAEQETRKYCPCKRPLYSPILLFSALWLSAAANTDRTSPQPDACTIAIGKVIKPYTVRLTAFDLCPDNTTAQ